jgi:hypothetical protein
MTKADRIILDLINALDAIERADNIHFAHGIANQAIKNAKHDLQRNTDGYLTVKA